MLRNKKPIYIYKYYNDNTDMPSEIVWSLSIILGIQIS